MSSILLVPVPPLDRELFQTLRGSLQSIFGVPVSLYPKDRIDPVKAFDPVRNQYNSSVVLSTVLEHFGGDGNKVLGVTGVDLFVPVLTFVFGEAQLDGTAALVSTFRLDETFYGLTPNRKLYEQRLIKEAVHELGHTFGLIHCHDYRCVMHSSTSVEEIDVKGAEFCDECVEKLKPYREQ
jgi:archaemetzincin